MPDPWIILVPAVAVVGTIVVVILYRRVAALDRRIEDAEVRLGMIDEYIHGEWEADEPVIDWQACLTGPALAAMVHGIDDRHHATELWEAEQEERDYDSAA
jgi:hypothetical protein